MKETYITIAGTFAYYGNDFFKEGMLVQLVKEPDNLYDGEAIMVKVRGLGKVGYVANSVKTVKGECISAGRLYDRIGDTAKAEVIIACNSFVICQVLIGDEIRF